MISQLFNSCRRSIQFKLFLSLTLMVALSLSAILACQVYLVQEYFIHQAESNLRSSNYLLSRVLADPLYAKDLTLLKTRLEDIQTKLPLCNFQLKNDLGNVVYKIGEVHTLSDSDLGSSIRDQCFNTVLPVIHGDQLMGTVRMGVRTDDIAQARKGLIQQSAFFAMFWFAIFMLPFFIQIRRLTSPLIKLSKAAQEISNGNLNYPAPMQLRREDEVSQLITSFNGMTQSLIRHRDEQVSILHALESEKTTLNTLLSTMPVGVVFVLRKKTKCCQCGATFGRVRGKRAQVVAFEGALEPRGEFVPVRLRRKLVLRLDFRRGELLEELLAEGEKVVGRGRGGRGRSRCGARR